jgi:hypothetical protein
MTYLLGVTSDLRSRTPKFRLGSCRGATTLYDQGGWIWIRAHRVLLKHAFFGLLLLNANEDG